MHVTDLRLRPSQFAVARSQSREIVTGAPGGRCGASHLLRVLAIQHAARAEGNRVALIHATPELLRDQHVYGPHGLLSMLSELAAHGAVDISTTAARFANGSTISLHPASSSQEMDRLLVAGPELVLVDGADEIDPATIQRLRERLADHAGRYAGLVCASAAEPWPGPAWADVETARRRPLDPREIEDLLLAQASRVVTNERGWPRGYEPFPKQLEFCESEADITIIGGSVGSGKSAAMLLDPVPRLLHDSDFRAVILRRHFTEIEQDGGLWDEAVQFYDRLPDVRKRSSKRQMIFPSKARLSFGAADRFEDVESEKKGLQVAQLGFDQLEDFEEEVFWYMFSRVRSARSSGRPLIRGNCNAKAESFLITGKDGWGSGLLGWWVGKDGYVIPERAGVMRWIARDADDRVINCATPEEVIDQVPGAAPISLVYILANLEDNPRLMEADPDYARRIGMLPKDQRERLYKHNWLIRKAGGKIFDVDDIPVLRGTHPGEVEEDGHVLDPIMASVIAYDFAGTEGAGDSTAAVRADRLRSGRVVLVPLLEVQIDAAKVPHAVTRIQAAADRRTIAHLPQDPNSGGKYLAEHVRRELRRLGYRVVVTPVTRSKVARSSPLAAAASPVVEGEEGRILIWDNGNGLGERLHTCLHNFDGAEGGDDDLVDAAADAFFEVDRQAMGGGIL